MLLEEGSAPSRWSLSLAWASVIPLTLLRRSAVAHLVAAPHAPSYLTRAHCPHPPPPLSTFLSRARPFRSWPVPLPTLSCYCSQILFLIFSFHFIALLLARANSFLKLLLLPRSVLFSRTSWDDGYTLFCRVQFNSHMWLMLPKS